MTQTILIGLNRRITLDELYSLSLGGGGDAKLEMMVHNTTTSGEDEHGGGDDDAAGVAVAAGNEEEHPSLLIAALRDLVLNSTSDAATDAAAAAAGGELLSEGATIASLALLSLTLSQGRVIRGECATQLSSALVDLVNSILLLREEGGGGVRLPANGTEFAISVNALLLQNQQQQQQQVGVVIPVEDKPYLGRLILLARVSLMLAQGASFHLCFCFLMHQLLSFDYFSRKLPF